MSKLTFEKWRVKCSHNFVKHSIFCSKINENADTSSRSLIENISLLHVNEHLLSNVHFSFTYNLFPHGIFLVYSYIIYVPQCPAVLYNVPKIFMPISKYPGIVLYVSKKSQGIVNYTVHRHNLSVWNLSLIKPIVAVQKIPRGGQEILKQLSWKFRE